LIPVLSAPAGLDLDSKAAARAETFTASSVARRRMNKVASPCGRRDPSPARLTGAPDVERFIAARRARIHEQIPGIEFA
jgi:hypothetical protein